MPLTLLPGVQLNNGDTVDGDNGVAGADNLMDLVRLATASGIDDTNFDPDYVNGAPTVPSLRNVTASPWTDVTASTAVSAADTRLSNLNSSGNGIANRIAAGASAATAVVIGNTPPSLGQTLIASSATAAAWGTPSVGALITGIGTITSVGTTVTAATAGSFSGLRAGFTLEVTSGAQDDQQRRVTSVAANGTTLEVASAFPADISVAANWGFYITPAERPYNTVSAKTAVYTVLSSDRGVLFTMDTTSTLTVSGNVLNTADSITVTGDGSTLFTTELVVGQRITIGTETRYIATIGAINSLTVDRPFELANGLASTNTYVAYSAGAVFTFTLPAASVFADGDTIGFEKISDDAQTMKITPNGSDTIDGVNAAIQYRTKGALVLLVKNGANWRIAHERYKAGEVIQRVRVQTRAATSSVASSRWIPSGQPVIANAATLGNKLQVSITPKSAHTRLRFLAAANLAAGDDSAIGGGALNGGNNVLLMLGLARTGDTNCLAVGTGRFPGGISPDAVNIDFETQSPAASAQTYTCVASASNMTSGLPSNPSVLMYLNRAAGTPTTMFVDKYVSSFECEEVAI